MSISDEELSQLITSYLNDENKCVSPCWAEFEHAETLERAIEIAVRSIDVNGKRHSHQWRIPKGVLKQLEQQLLADIALIEVCNDFDMLHNLVAHHVSTIKGAGPLLTYDVALRIGSNFLKLEPQLVYLHAGALQGARKLGVREKVCRLSDLPKPMQRLTHSQAEDFLCIYKDRL